MTSSQTACVCEKNVCVFGMCAQPTMESMRDGLRNVWSLEEVVFFVIAHITLCSSDIDTPMLNISSLSL